MRPIKPWQNIMLKLEKNKREHLPSSQEELTKLWSLKEIEPVASLILIQCYTGFRPNELLDLELSAVDLVQNIVIGGSKTTAGKNRVVPIHPAILPLVKSHYTAAKEKDRKWLFNTTDPRFPEGKLYQRSYHRYSRDFHSLIEKYNMNPQHRPHDPRKTFVTEAKRYGVDDNVIKILVGHAITDLTEAVYTQRDLDWLRKDLQKIQVPDVQIVHK